MRTSKNSTFSKLFNQAVETVSRTAKKRDKRLTLDRRPFFVSSKKDIDISEIELTNSKLSISKKI